MKDFLKKNPKYSLDNIIAYVNVNRDYNYYDNIKDTDTSKDTLMLVNKYYKLSEDYTPDDLVTYIFKLFLGNGWLTKNEKSRL